MTVTSGRYTIVVSGVDAGGWSITFEVESGSEAELAITQVRIRPGTSNVNFPAMQLSGFDFASSLQLAARLFAGAGDPPMSVRDSQQPAPLPPNGSVEAPVANGPDLTKKSPQQSKGGAPSDLARTYWRLGSVPQVARHYDVPRQVARDWISELQARQELPKSWRPRRTK